MLGKKLHHLSHTLGNKIHNGARLGEKFFVNHGGEIRRGFHKVGDVAQVLAPVTVLGGPARVLSASAKLGELAGRRLEKSKRRESRR
jgi:hypothetical protein